MNRSRPFKFSVSPPNTNTKATTLGRKQQLAQSKLKNVLDVRVIPGHPQQAWVECYDHSFDEEAQEGIAELHAHEIHKKYEKMKLDRDQKLKDFQTDVNQRVRYLEKMKRKQMKLNTMKKEEEEQNVILQRTLGLKVPYRGTVEDLRALNKELLKSCIVPSEANKQLIKNEIEKSNRLLTNTCSQVSHDSSNARKSMLTKKISVDTDPISPSRSMKIFPRKSPILNKPLADEWTGSFEIKRHDGQNSAVITENAGLEVGVEKDTGNEVRYDQRGEENMEEEGINGTDSAIMIEEKCHFEDDTGVSSLHRDLVMKMCNNSNHGVLNDWKQNPKGGQYWNYRKIFMEIEREQVQEHRRKQEHRKRILRLKIEKEREREIKEGEISQFPEVTVVNTTADCDRLNNTNAKGVAVTPNKLKTDQQEDKENEEDETELYRYIDALRQTSKERTRINGVFLPPLCPCGPSIWDTHPESCANNCVFYKNPKGYIRALTTVLANNR